MFESVGLFLISRVVPNLISIPRHFELILKVTYFFALDALDVRFSGVKVVVSVVLMFSVSMFEVVA